MIEVVSPTEFGHEFIRTDARYRHQFAAVTPPPPPNFRDEALCRFAIRKARRFAADSGIVMTEPIVEYERNAGMRSYSVYVWFEYVKVPEMEAGEVEVVLNPYMRQVNQGIPVIEIQGGAGG